MNFLKAKIHTRACARVSACALLQSGRQTRGLFSCQCPAATPAGLFLGVTPRLTSTPSDPEQSLPLRCVRSQRHEDVCVCVCVSQSVRELSSLQNEPDPKSAASKRSRHLATQKPQHSLARARTVAQHINSISSLASSKLLILRWLTFSVFEALPI